VSGFLDLALLFDMFLSILLVITIVYAIILNKKLKSFRDAQTAMAGLSADLGAAIGRAEDGLAKVRAEAEQSGLLLTQRGETARRLANDLALLEERAARTSDRLEKLSGGEHDEARRLLHAVKSGHQRPGAASATDAAADEAAPIVRALRGLR
jgi:hypothetical protein